MKEAIPFIVIHDTDNVAVAVREIREGEIFTIHGSEVMAITAIPFGHKMALTAIKEGQNVIKYGYPIGHALVDIQAGEQIHVHNLKTNLSGVLDYTYQPKTDTAADLAYHSASLQPAGMAANGNNRVKTAVQLVEDKPVEGASSSLLTNNEKKATFQGYMRPNGRVGIRNEIWIIPTVGCVNTTAKRLEQEAAHRIEEQFAGKVDGVYAYTHNMGCSQLSDDHARTQQILKGLVEHPNAAGVLILSLGCENNNLDQFKPILGDYDENRVRFLVTQDVENEYETGMVILEELAEYASQFQREPVGADHLVLGFKCGGSDAFSGITANALCGRINDKVTAQGGSTILTEVPEMFGAETLLMERAVDRDTFDQTVHLINDFKEYFTKYNQAIYENPSPGNKKGGITTLEEKSLGCTQKGGQAPVTDVLTYGEPVRKSGLNLLTGPGNDQVSCTNLVASGAQMVLFTTGRGNPFGSPAPTVKISSNTGLYNRKKHWIDYNAGQLLDGASFEEVTKDFYQYLLRVASGEELTRNETYGYREISIFRDGVIL